MTDQDDILFQAELRPNKSSTLKGVHIFVGFLLAVFIPTGVIFVIAGAWPVFGFMGVELLLLYGALRLSQRRTGTMERISLTAESLTIERINHRGDRRIWSAPPHWLRVHVEDPPTHRPGLLLRTHGQSITIGRFLTLEEREEIAGELRRALFAFNRM